MLEKLYRLEYNKISDKKTSDKRSDKMVIIINGGARTGKDTFVNMCDDFFWEKDIYMSWASMIDCASAVVAYGLENYNMHKTLDEHGSYKDEKYRKLLYDVKQALDEFDDLSFKSVIEDYNFFISQFYLSHPDNQEKRVYFINSRETKDIKHLIKYFTEKGELVRTVYIIRPEMEIIKSNEADRQAIDDTEIEYDYTIINAGSRDEFMEKAENFVEMIDKEIKEWILKNSNN